MRIVTPVMAVRELETPFLADEYLASREMLERVRARLFRSIILVFPVALMSVGVALLWGAWIGVCGIAAIIAYCGILVVIDRTGFGMPRIVLLDAEVWRRLSEVSSDLQRRALRLYGTSDSAWPALFAAIECHESHLPGDCPLCGAQ
jgi:hypothetical protein